MKELLLQIKMQILFYPVSITSLVRTIQYVKRVNLKLIPTNVTKPHQTKAVCMNRCLNSASYRNLYRMPFPSLLLSVSVKVVFSLGSVSMPVVSASLFVMSVYVVSVPPNVQPTSVFVVSAAVWSIFVVSAAVFSGSTLFCFVCSSISVNDPKFFLKIKPLPVEGLRTISSTRTSNILCYHANWWLQHKCLPPTIAYGL